TNANGNATMNFKDEYFNVFGLEGAFDTLPAGDWNVNMNLLGYYEWNGGAVTESQIKSVTITLTAPGTLTLNALQAARTDTVNYVEDGANSNGSLGGKVDVLLGDVNGDDTVTTIDARMIISHILGAAQLSNDQLAVSDYNNDASVSTMDVRAILMSVLTA
ncbi:MAG: dockerin type I repeat-containing protein, partial [Clostridia bacterium]|nr:dockerin type I repeat-containing protein [Clostridia bacterium]